MQFLAEQHLAVAKLLRQKAVNGTGKDRVRFVGTSNGFVNCASLSAVNQGGICLDNFDWLSVSQDWALVERQLAYLSPPVIVGPSLGPEL
jgi:hypothetical protein